eukprot:CAMPEP_0178445668 /NCGR_PEP_ID=MMETSP0689_2-20121128/40314_1 /TAXON_ID=160604 /ORGANISM="Amphidinium massartii, Strain CS-259" /LENGTH=31 /DNA_ID= /DNA_START= /DNA_END= /DNA_ORIENTATION=
MVIGPQPVVQQIQLAWLERVTESDQLCLREA